MKEDNNCCEQKIYLDNSATTKIDKRVKQDMENCYDCVYGNPGSFHSIGLKAKNVLDGAREKVAKILNARSTEIIFTAGGTESINLAIKGLAYAQQSVNGKKHIVTTKIEHHAVLHTCEYLEKKGFEITYLDVDKDGLIDVEELRNSIREDTFLVSIIWANNEIGTVQDIGRISKICKDNGVFFHVDGCQAGCYLDLNVGKLGVDMLSLNGSKIYGPKGVGMLYLKRGVHIEPLIHGGEQEMGKRAGTENVAGIVGFTKALEIAQSEMLEECNRLKDLRDFLIKGILNKIPKTRLNGHVEKRLPNNVNVSFLDIEGESILLYLDSKGIYASSGSACTSKTLDPSHVVLALGSPYEYAHGSIRFTLGRETSKKDMEYVLKELCLIVANLREISPFNVDEKKLEIKK
tara:strand:+ start:121 stop:1335 length:1215 start_codon:yes stop_codon:yes gene_type:complete